MPVFPIPVSMVLLVYPMASAGTLVDVHQASAGNDVKIVSSPVDFFAHNLHRVRRRSVRFTTVHEWRYLSTNG